LGAGVFALVAKLYVTSVISSALYAMLKKDKIVSEFSFTKVMEILRWSTHRYGAILLTFAGTYAADLVLGALLSPSATGLYRGSSRLVTSVADLFNQPTRLMAMTFYSKRASRGVESGEVLPLVLAIAAAFGWSALMGLAVVSPLIVPLLLGPSWEAAAPIATVLCFARAFSLIDSCVTPALVAYNKQKWVLYVQTMTVPLLILLLFLTSGHGPVYSSYAVAVVALVNTICLLVVARKYIRTPFSVVRSALPLALLPPLFVGVFSLAIEHFNFVTYPSKLSELLIIVLATGCGWLGLMVVLRGTLRNAILRLKHSA
jgi:O-antigen/teichoic acid export membrane protein